MAEIKNKRTQTAENIAVSVRNYRRARDRALSKLSRLYPDDYKQLLDHERKADEETGKKWLDISGATVLPADNSGDTDGSFSDTRPVETKSDYQIQSN